MCGLFGIINTQPKKFDKRAFFTLGINNDSRGGDACGVFIDGKVDYGTGNENKYFLNFFDKSEVLNNTKECRIALGHCRKASVGGVHPEKAQPCVIYNSENPNKIDFVLTHNGTIKNYSELANKYIPNVDIKDMSDSQVITRIIYEHGWDILTEYVGTAAIIAVDYRNEKPQVFLWHGASLATRYVTKVTEERPLYLITDKNLTAYSSIADYLYSLYYNHKVLELSHNTLCTINDKGSLVVYKEYDRSQCVQSDYASTNTTTVVCRTYDDDDDYGYGYYRYGYSKSQGGEVAKNKKEGNTVVNGFLKMDSDFIITNNISTKVHGKFIVNPYGRILSNEDLKTYANPKTIYVFNGVVVNNKDAFDTLSTIANAWEVSPQELFDLMPELIYTLSPYPFRNNALCKSYLAHVMKEDNVGTKLFTGTVHELFSPDIYTYQDGVKSYNPSKSCALESFDLLDRCKNLEVPRQIIIDYLNDLV